MIVYSINDIEKLSGVKAHTIRIWERRYNVIAPKRSSNNVRYYDDDDLRVILNIAILNKNGIKISHIAKLSNVEISKKVSSISEVDSIFEDSLDSLTLSVLEISDRKFSRILDKKIEQNGFEHTMEQVVYPLLDKLSVMWIAGSIKGAHEHFVSNIIRRKTIHAIENLKVSYTDNQKKALVYLPENENHELSKLYLHYILKKRGLETINLGSNIPLSDVIEANKIFNPHYIFTIINDSFASASIQDYINKMSEYMPDAEIILSGYQVINQNIDKPKNCKVVSGLNDIKKMFSTGLKKMTPISK